MRAHRPLAPYLFIAPALAVFGFAVLMPFVFTGAYSLTDWDGYSDAVFVGVDNYVQALGDTVFQQSFVNVVVYILVTLVVEVLLGLVLAGIAISVKRGSLWFRVAIFTPVMLPMVVVAVLWSFVYNPDFGLVNGALRAFGLEDWTRVWLGDEQTALLAICVVSGWVYAGFYMTIFFAALRQVPTEVVEAARLDGAKESTIFWRVRVPIIRTSIEVAILLCVTGGFQSFDLFYVLTNGGPYHSTEIPTTYLVQSVFHTGQVGYGSAMAVVLTASSSPSASSRPSAGARQAARTPTNGPRDATPHDETRGGDPSRSPLRPAHPSPPKRNWSDDPSIRLGRGITTSASPSWHSSSSSRSYGWCSQTFKSNAEIFTTPFSLPTESTSRSGRKHGKSATSAATPSTARSSHPYRYSRSWCSHPRRPFAFRRYRFRGPNSCSACSPSASSCHCSHTSSRRARSSPTSA